MPYRGTNSKRNVVHDKSRGTIKSSSRDHFLSEKKEHEHELSQAKETILRLQNEGYRYQDKFEEHNSVSVLFVNSDKQEKRLEFKFPDNFDQLKEMMIHIW
ncbi:hypothetical protein [Fusibacter bizertensis]